MPDREKTIKGLQEIVDDNWMKTHADWYVSVCSDALAMLKEQDNETKRIMTVVWDTLHEGLSIDTVADQDWVYELIRHRIEDR